MNIYFNSNLRFLRIRAGLRQEDLAKKLNKDRSLIGHWESDNRTPTIEDCIKIAEYFNVALEKLLLSDLRIQDNETDNKIKKLSTDNGVTIEVAKSRPLTNDDFIEIQRLLFKEMEENKPPKN